MAYNRVDMEEIPENAIPVKFHIEYEPYGIKLILDEIQHIANEDQLHYVWDQGTITEVYIIRKDPDV